MKYNHREMKAIMTPSGGEDGELRVCLLVHQFRTAAAVPGYLQGAALPYGTKAYFRQAKQELPGHFSRLLSKQEWDMCCC